MESTLADCCSDKDEKKPFNKAEYMKEYQKKNKEKFKEYRKRWRDSHKDEDEYKAKCAAQARKHYQQIKSNSNKYLEMISSGGAGGNVD